MCARRCGAVNGVTVAPKTLMDLESPIGAASFQIQRVRGPQPLDTIKVMLRCVAPATLLSKVKVGDVDTGGLDYDVDVLARVTAVSGVRAINAVSAEMEITLEVNAQRANDGWLYDSVPLRVGSSMPLRTGRYELTGVVTDIVAPRE